MWRTTAVDRVVPRGETGPSSIVRLSATPPPACCSPVALALPVYAAAVAASVNGPMSRGTRFCGGVDGGLDTPGSAAGAVFLDVTNAAVARFPETVKGRSHAREFVFII